MKPLSWLAVAAAGINAVVALVVAGHWWVQGGLLSEYQQAPSLILDAALQASALRGQLFEALYLGTTGGALGSFWVAFLVAYRSLPIRRHAFHRALWVWWVPLGQLVWPLALLRELWGSPEKTPKPLLFWWWTFWTAVGMAALGAARREAAGDVSELSVALQQQAAGAAFWAGVLIAGIALWWRHRGRGA